MKKIAFKKKLVCIIMCFTTATHCTELQENCAEYGDLKKACVYIRDVL